MRGDTRYQDPSVKAKCKKRSNRELCGVSLTLEHNCNVTPQLLAFTYTSITRFSEALTLAYYQLQIISSQERFRVSSLAQVSR